MRLPRLHRPDSSRRLAHEWSSSAQNEEDEILLLLLFNTTRTLSGPPSTRATITMDGGVADTARAAAAVQHNAHNLRTPKHEGL